MAWAICHSLRQSLDAFFFTGLPLAGTVPVLAEFHRLWFMTRAEVPTTHHALLFCVFDHGLLFSWPLAIISTSKATPDPVHLMFQIRVVKAFQAGLDRNQPPLSGTSAARLREITRQLQLQHHDVSGRSLPRSTSRQSTGGYTSPKKTDKTAEAVTSV